MSERAQNPADDLPWPGAIGMCLSGGGYRATVFHLGVFNYLQRLDLLENIRMISAVSGATFTVGSYVLSLVEHKPYNQFFADFYRTLAELNLADVALAELAHTGTARPSGRENLILAMADVYSRIFYTDPNGEPYRFGDILDSDIHLDELLFNALDYRRAESFLFQRSEASDVVVGNDNVSVARADAADIRMGDIIATCTSIPAAFEPMAFPDDFHWPGGQVPTATREQFTDQRGQPSPVPLMDGGLHDNQGIESLLLADQRHPEDLDVFVLSDVFREPEVHYSMPAQRGIHGPTLRTLATLAWLLFVACAITGTSLAVRVGTLLVNGDFQPLWHTTIYIGPFVMSMVALIVLWWVRQTVVRVLLPQIPQIGVHSRKYLRKVSLSQIVEMVDIRLLTLVATSTTIVWKRVRNLGYRLIYGNPAYEGKRVSCLLQNLRPGEAIESVPGIPQPSEALHTVAEVAGSMPTILWFQNDLQLPCLVATGEATLCFNLMKFIVRHHGDDPASYPDEVAQVWRQLSDDWLLLSGDPFALIRERMPTVTLPDLPDTSDMS